VPVFEQFAGLPAHPLLVHAAVVFIPLLAGGSLLYALFARLRYRLRWPVGFLALAAAGATVFARQSGQAFRSRLIAKNLASPEILAKLVQHKQFGDATMWATLGLAVAALVFVLAVPGRPPGFEAPRTGGLLLQIIFSVVLIALSIASVYYVVRTGDSGARIVWTGF
jgi:glucan phosphoethanolaminetransferase (alkaline phosphatase superfamily)